MLFFNINFNKCLVTQYGHIYSMVIYYSSSLGLKEIYSNIKILLNENSEAQI